MSKPFCYYCANSMYYCPRCYRSEGLAHTHEDDYMCDSCGFVGPFLTPDELLLHRKKIEDAKEQLCASR